MVHVAGQILALVTLDTAERNVMNISVTENLNQVKQSVVEMVSVYMLIVVSVIMTGLAMLVTFLFALILLPMDAGQMVFASPQIPANVIMVILETNASWSLATELLKLTTKCAQRMESAKHQTTACVLLDILVTNVKLQSALEHLRMRAVCAQVMEIVLV